MGFFYICAMKRIIATLLIAFTGITALAQNDNVLKFLGIPMSINEYTMRMKLQQKGFKYDSQNGCLSGRFNGLDSFIYLSENKGSVDRVMVADASPIDKKQIRSQYNTLLGQFQKNSKYFEIDENLPIPNNEDISYQMNVNNKAYEAYFYLRAKDGSEPSFENLTGMVWFTIREFESEFYICIYYDNIPARPNGEDL